MRVKKITQKQRDMVDLLFSQDGTLEEILEQNGTPIKRFLDWMQDEVFAQYLKEQTDARIAAAEMSAWSALIRGVAHGEPASIKLFFEMKAKAAASEQEKKPSGAGLMIQMDVAAKEAGE